jgi:hypothetical protein
MTKKVKGKLSPGPSPAPPPEVKPAALAAIAKKIKSRRGRKKERTQISVRLDKTLMDIAHIQVENTGMRITDLIERGVLLALREMGVTDPLAHHARLILHDEGVEFSRLVLNVNTLRRFPEIRKLSLTENAWRECVLDTVAKIQEWPNAREVAGLMGTPSHLVGALKKP